VLRVAELLHADPSAVRRATDGLPRRVTAAIAELAAGTLLTLETRRRWWDRRPRRRVIAGLHQLMQDIEQATGRVVIVAAALIRDGRALAAQRSHPPSMAGKWEFPGGKVERGETPQAALIRECAEELGTSILVGPELGRARLDSGATLILFAASLPDDAGPPLPLEHQNLGWYGSEQLSGLDWLTSNRQFVPDVTRRL
jgi:8-oxo-dGTP pyrophosphatase MutT (NUDIX family)